MRRALLWTLAVVSAVFVVDRVAEALNGNQANSELAPYVQPSPFAPKHPDKLTLAGSAFTCKQLTWADAGAAYGQCLRVSCTVDCAYDVGVYEPDGGVMANDGNYNATADSNQLPSATPEAFCLTATQNGICVYSASAGAAYVSKRYP